MDHVAYQFHDSSVLTLSCTVLFSIIGGCQLLANKVVVVEFGCSFVDELATPVGANNLNSMTSIAKNLANSLLDTG
jgi:hypothetical protein